MYYNHWATISHRKVDNYFSFYRINWMCDSLYTVFGSLFACTHSSMKRNHIHPRKQQQHQKKLSHTESSLYYNTNLLPFLLHFVLHSLLKIWFIDGNCIVSYVNRFSRKFSENAHSLPILIPKSPMIILKWNYIKPKLTANTKFIQLNIMPE